jgi:hypothetical protein
MSLNTLLFYKNRITNLQMHGSTKAGPILIILLLVLAGYAATPSFGKTPNPEASVIDSHGNFVDRSRVGSSLTISKIFLNANDTVQEFTVIFEVRMNDVTQYLNLSGGVLPPSKAIHVTSSWMPEIPGEYQIRVFVVSNMTKPVLIETVPTSRFMVF